LYKKKAKINERKKERGKEKRKRKNLSNKRIMT